MLCGMARKKRGRGRPLLVSDPDVEKRFLDAVSSGVPLKHAATYAGMSERTVFNTLSRAEEAAEKRASGVPLAEFDVVAFEFAEKVRRARSMVSVRNVGLIQKAATGGHVLEKTTKRYRDPETGQLVEEESVRHADIDWRAAKWLLEKSFAADFGPAAQHIELTGLDGQPVQVETSSVVASLNERLALVAAQRAEDAVRDEDEVIDVEVVEE